MRDKKWLIVAASVVLIGCLVMFLQKENIKNSEQTEKYEELDSKLRPLNVKKRELTVQLEELQESYEAKRRPKASTQIVFTELDPQVYEVCYPLMKTRGFTGVLALSKTEFPGVDGCMTQEQFNKLIKEGWTVCITWDNYQKFEKWWPDLKKGIKQIGLEEPKVIYYPRGTYRAEYDESLKKVGFHTVIHHAETGRALIQTQYEEGLWHLGAMGLSGGKTKTEFDNAIQTQGNIIYLVGFTLEDELYEELPFTNMLNFFVKHQNQYELIVGSVEDARQHYYSRQQEVSEEEEKEYLKTKADLEAQLSELQRQIDELSK